MPNFSISYSFEALDNFSAKSRAIAGSLRKVGNSATLANTKLRKFGQNLSGIGRKMMLRVSAPMAAMSVMAVKTGATFEKSMNMVQAVSGATGKQFQKLEVQAQRLGATTQFTGSQAAEGQKFLAMAGFKTNKILDAMPGTLQLAASAQLDLGSAANIVTNIMTGYNMKADQLSRANDVLVATFTSTNTNLVELGQAMKMVGPIASSVQMKFTDAAAAIGLMGNAGIQGTMAGTSLRRAIGNMINPTAQMQKVMKQGNLVFKDAKGQLLPLTNIMAELKKAGITTAGMLTLFGQRGGPAMAALLSQGAPALAALEKKLNASGGLAQRVADVQMKGLTGAFLKLKSAVEGVNITYTKAAEPAIVRYTNKLTTLFGKLNHVSTGTKKFAGFILVMGTLSAPILIVLGKIAIVMSVLGTRIPIVAAANRLLGLSFKFLWRGILGPIGALIAIGSLLVLAYKHSEIFRKVVNALGKALFSGIVAPIHAAIKLFHIFISLFQKIHKLSLTHRAAVATAPLPPPTAPAVGAGGRMVGGFLGHLLAPQQHTVKSSLHVSIHDPTDKVKSVTGKSEGGKLSFDMGANMAGARI